MTQVMPHHLQSFIHGNILTGGIRWMDSQATHSYSPDLQPQLLYTKRHYRGVKGWLPEEVSPVHQSSLLVI